MLAMGLVQLPEIAQYWEKDEDGLFNADYFNRLISRDRFFELRGSLSYDYEFLETEINKRFKACWIPEAVLVVDECLILFKGRFAHRQHIRGKPHATGLKFYMLCDRRGYCYGFWLYRGPDSAHSNSQSCLVADLADSVIGPAVWGTLENELFVPDDGAIDYDYLVDALAEKFSALSTKRHLIVADSYFGSLKAAEKVEDKFYFLFAVRANVDARVKGKLAHKLEKGTWRTIYKDDISYTTFNDRAVCTFISNFRAGNRAVDKVPAVVHTYNQTMNAVDMFDSHLGLHYYAHRQDKWTQCAFYALLKMAVTNLWVYFADLNKCNMTNTQFIEHLVREGLAKYGKPSNTSQVTLQFAPGGISCPDHIIVNPHTGIYKQCVYCSKRSNTPYKCKKCNRYMHADCFEPYHRTQQ